MTALKLYQICYSADTLAACDPALEPLDNLANPRPDWREYWPMRAVLADPALEQASLYGFFSPRFAGKTGISGADARAFIASHEADVYLFSPFFDHSAYYLNIFEQAEANHPGIAPTLRAAFAEFAPQVSLDSLVMSSRDTVFCNYLVATGGFWSEWIEHAERLYAIAEAKASALAGMLNAEAPYVHAGAQAKVFVMERLASFLLNRGGWRVAVCNPMTLGYGNSFAANFKSELCQLDALKIAYQTTGYSEYLDRFHSVRSGIVKVAQHERGRSTARARRGARRTHAGASANCAHAALPVMAGDCALARCGAADSGAAGALTRPPGVGHDGASPSSRNCASSAAISRCISAYSSRLRSRNCCVSRSLRPTPAGVSL
jgi:hypothetical protein